MKKLVLTALVLSIASQSVFAETQTKVTTMKQQLELERKQGIQKRSDNYTLGQQYLKAEEDLSKLNKTLYVVNEYRKGNRTNLKYSNILYAGLGVSFGTVGALLLLRGERFFAVAVGGFGSVVSGALIVDNITAQELIRVMDEMSPEEFARFQARLVKDCEALAEKISIMEEQLMAERNKV